LFQFGSLSPSDKIDILINVTVDPSNTFRDNQFHHASISSTLKYRGLDPCATENESHQVLHFPFFCSGMAALSLIAIGVNKKYFDKFE
jgi:hypothetical protein